MEQDSQEKPLNLSEYKVKWHPEIKDDFSKLSSKLTDSITKAAEYRLSKAPHMIGQPLKGTTNLLWKLRFDKYRIIYTMNPKAKEVWVLSVRKREIVYKDKHIQSLLNLALALQHQIENS